MRSQETEKHEHGVAKRLAGAVGEGTTRLEAFSDGVFSIAITLLILDIKVPDLPAGGALSDALIAMGSNYITYLTSFAVIGIIWINHHNVFKDIRRTDSGLLVCNLLVLLCVSFIPFPAALLGSYVDDATNAYLAAAVYAGTMIATVLTFQMMWLYVSSKGLLRDGLAAKTIRTRTLSGWLGLLLYGAAFGFAFVNVNVTIGIFIVVATLFLLLSAIDLF